MEAHRTENTIGGFNQLLAREKFFNEVI